MRGLAGKVVVVTGATKAMGEAIARRFVEEGSVVVGCGRSADLGEAVAARLRAEGGDVVFQQADVSVEADVVGVVELARERFGRLDVVVNNAAAVDVIRGGGERRVTEASLETLGRVLGVGVHGPFLFFKHAIPVMVQGGGGTFVHLSSVAAVLATDGIPAYTTSKGALEALSRQVAGEYGHDGIRSNVITVGTIRTPDNQRFHEDPRVVAALRQGSMVPRVGVPDDVAAMTAFLASDDSAFVSGAVLALDGGRTAKNNVPSLEDLYVAPTS